MKSGVPRDGLSRFERSTCRLLLSFVPRELRQEAGEDWLAFLAEQRKEVRYRWPVFGAARFWKDVVFDVAITAVQVWRSSEGLRRTGHPRLTTPQGMRALTTSVWQDVLYAERSLRRSPGFTVAVVTTLALGIGANTAIYSLVYGVILQPLPYPNAEHLVWVGHETGVEGPESRLGLNSELYLHYRGLNRTLEDIAIFRALPVDLGGDGASVRSLSVVEASEGLLNVLQVQPALGRWFRADEVTSDAAVAVLSHELWTTEFGEDGSIVGRTIRLGDVAHDVIGVMPSGFTFPYRTELARPYRVHQLAFNPVQPFGHFRSQGLARLKPDVTAPDAQSDLTALIPRLQAVFPGDLARFVVDEAGLRPEVVPLKHFEVANVERRLWILQGVVALVLLIACANVANLFLVRGQARRRAVAVRVALGAGRVRLLRWYMTESVLLAMAGGAIALTIAYVSVRLFVDMAPLSFKRWAELGPIPQVGVDGQVLLFTLAVSVGTGLVLASTLGLRSPSDVLAPLQEGGRWATLGRFRLRARQAFVVGQVALALILLVGAGLMTSSLWHLERVGVGFDAADVHPFSIDARQMDRASMATAHQALLDRLAALPGVEAAGASRCPPLNPPGFCILRNTITPESLRGKGPAGVSAALNVASPGFFQVLRIPILTGRAIERTDHEQLTDAVVVSASLAESLWPNQDAVGQRIHLGLPAEPPAWLPVVGVAGDVQPHSLTAGRDASRSVYTPMVTSSGVERSPRRLQFYVRAAVPPLALADAIQEAVSDVYGAATVEMMTQLEERVTSVKAPTVVTTLLIGLAALLALALAIIGVYGVTSYVASHVKGELGIRKALGATAGDVIRMVLERGGLPIVLGLVLGLIGAALLGDVLDTLLFEVSPLDPITYACVAVLLSGVGLAATFLPAREAARVDPVEALRAD